MLFFISFAQYYYQLLCLILIYYNLIVYVFTHKIIGRKKIF